MKLALLPLIFPMFCIQVSSPSFRRLLLGHTTQSRVSVILVLVLNGQRLSNNDTKLTGIILLLEITTQGILQNDHCMPLTSSIITVEMMIEVIWSRKQALILFSKRTQTVANRYERLIGICLYITSILWYLILWLTMHNSDPSVALRFTPMVRSLMTSLGSNVFQKACMLTQSCAYIHSGGARSR